MMHGSGNNILQCMSREDISFQVFRVNFFSKMGVSKILSYKYSQVGFQAIFSRCRFSNGFFFEAIF